MTVVACSKCGDSKDTSQYHRSNGNSTGYRPDCKLCRAIVSKKWTVANPGARTMAVQAWSLRNPEKAAATFRRYHEKNYVVRRAQSREWQKAHLAQDAERSAKQRASLFHATPSWANKAYINLFYEMAKLEEVRTGRMVHVDHIYPLNSPLVCGLHVEDNLQLLFAVDNIRKKNRLLELHGGGLSQS